MSNWKEREVLCRGGGIAQLSFPSLGTVKIICMLICTLPQLQRRSSPGNHVCISLTLCCVYPLS